MNTSVSVINVSFFFVHEQNINFSFLRLETLLNSVFFLLPYLWLLMLQNGRRLFVKGAESLVHFDIHILAVMILKAAIKLTVTSRGARGQQHKASSSRAASIAPAQDYSINTSFFQPPSLFLFSSFSLFFYYSLHQDFCSGHVVFF